MWNCHSAVAAPEGVAYVVAFGYIGECHDVARIVVVACLVGYPNLDAVYGHAREHCGQLRHRTVVVVAEVVSEEKVLVLVVIRDFKLVGGELCSSL